MLTKQTYLTQTGPGIKRPVLYFQGETNWKANLLEIHMLKSKDLRGSQRSEISGKSLSDGSTIIPTRGTESHNRQQRPQRQICWGNGEIPKYLQGDPQYQLRTAQSENCHESNSTQLHWGTTH
jgi:hypothetical protein